MARHLQPYFNPYVLTPFCVLDKRHYCFATWSITVYITCSYYMLTHIHTYSYSLLTPQQYVRLFCQRVALAVPLASAGIFNVSVLTSLWWLASWDWWPPSVRPVTPVALGLVTPVPSIEVGAASTGGFFSSTSADSEPGTSGEGRHGT